LASNPAASCADVVSSGSYAGPGLYYIAQKGSVDVPPVICNGTVNLGGNGSRAALVSASCAAISTYFGQSNGFFYIDPINSPPQQASAVKVYCLNGISLGGDGSTISSSSVSCAVLQQYWGIQNVTAFVNGAIT
jgi:hypothetical protein